MQPTKDNCCCFCCPNISNIFLLTELGISFYRIKPTPYLQLKDLSYDRMFSFLSGKKNVLDYVGHSLSKSLFFSRGSLKPVQNSTFSYFAKSINQNSYAYNHRALGSESVGVKKYVSPVTYNEVNQTSLNFNGFDFDFIDIVKYFYSHNIYFPYGSYAHGGFNSPYSLSFALKNKYLSHTEMFSLLKNFISIDFSFYFFLKALPGYFLSDGVFRKYIISYNFDFLKMVNALENLFNASGYSSSSFEGSTLYLFHYQGNNL